MKKLMIAAAIVCAAVVSQAAQFQWKASGVQGPTEGYGAYSGAAVLHIFAENFVGDEIEAIDGTMTAGVISIASVGTTDNYIQNTKYSAYYTMETEIDGVTYTFRSGDKTTKATSPSNAPFNFTSGGSWTAAPVPEPTSGLLLLLGVAGLALRRRRA